MTAFYNIHTFCRPLRLQHPPHIDFHNFADPCLFQPPFYLLPESIGLVTSLYIFGTFAQCSFSTVFQRLDYITLINIVSLHSIQYPVLPNSSQICIEKFQTSDLD